MIYRKAPPQPGRLLLRVVAVAGAGAVAGAVACSSSSSGGSVGFVSGAVDGGGSDVGADQVVSGSSTGGGFLAPDGGEEVGVGCDGCGLVGLDAATSDVLNGLVPPPDSGIE
jgi:hypothetical protein